MGLEIERKFLVADLSVLDRRDGVSFRQGYLSTTPERTVRVRVAGSTAFLTVKGVTVGATRSEFEYPVPLTEAAEMLLLCEPPIIEKVRYRIPHADLVWEVDVFTGVNEGLVVAEVEISSADTVIDLPLWVGAEVSTDPRYFNANLVRHPFTRW